MKITDYCPRAAPFDSLVKSGMIGIEVGCDAGAHAEALLTYQKVSMLYLIDLFPNAYQHGYIRGRLEAKGFINNIEIIGASSHAAAERKYEVDFVYIDIGHEYETVMQSINDWIPHVKRGGLLCHRNYSVNENYKALKKACDDFAAQYNLKTELLDTDFVFYL